MKIPFNIPYLNNKELLAIQKAMQSGSLSGDGFYVKQCNQWFKEVYNCKHPFMTHSCTAALEMAALILNIEADDEVIIPSFTHISTANAFALRGAKIVFADILPDTMCINPQDVVKKISKKTKAIVIVHYGGYASPIKKIKELCRANSLYLIEDAAHSIGVKKDTEYLGTLGDIGCISFHETKNIHCGEGGALLLNNNDLLDKTEQIYEKGSNRNAFLRNEVAKYEWTSLGSSFAMNNITAAFLYSQLESIETVNLKRKEIWISYYKKIQSIPNYNKFLSLPPMPNNIKEFNAHIFFIKAKSKEIAIELSQFLSKKEIQALKHFPPLHNSPFATKYKNANCQIVEQEYEKLIRLPIYTKLDNNKLDFIVQSIRKFCEEKL